MLPFFKKRTDKSPPTFFCYPILDFLICLQGQIVCPSCSCGNGCTLHGGFWNKLTNSYSNMNIYLEAEGEARYADVPQGSMTEEKRESKRKVWSNFFSPSLIQDLSPSFLCWVAHTYCSFRWWIKWGLPQGSESVFLRNAERWEKKALNLSKNTWHRVICLDWQKTYQMNYHYT